MPAGLARSRPLAIGTRQLRRLLQQARSLRLPPGFYRRRERRRRAYQILHGNWRGLEFFAAAVGDMDVADEAAFLDRLAETQTNMAMEAVIDHRTQDERMPLACLPAYQTPVPMEGIIKLALDLPDPDRLLEKLLAMSLVEQREAPDLLTREYQCFPLVAEWLRKNHLDTPSETRDLNRSRSPNGSRLLLTTRFISADVSAPTSARR